MLRRNFLKGLVAVATVPAAVYAGKKAVPETIAQAVTDSSLPEDIWSQKKHDDANFIDVTKYPYFARGDGITDDSKSFQLSLDHALIREKLTGKRVTIYVPSGTYNVCKIKTPIDLPRNTALQGDGRKRTVLNFRDEWIGRV